MPTRPSTLLPALLAAALSPLTGAGAAGAQAPTPTASIRAANLSPDTPPMDVYLTPFSGGEGRLLLPAVGYGAVSAYAPTQPGRYVFTMKHAGAPEADPGLLSLTAEIAAAGAYTIAGVGQGNDTSAVLLTDDLTPPPAGSANIRFINADPNSGAVTLQAAGGPTLASEVPFGTATGYAAVPAGAQRIDVTTAAVPQGAPMDVTLAPGTVTTLVLLQSDSPAGDLSAVVDAEGMTTISGSSVMSSMLDAAGSPAQPAVGAIATGGGGTATAKEPSTPALVPALLAATAVAGSVLLAAWRRHACAHSS